MSGKRVLLINPYMVKSFWNFPKIFKIDGVKTLAPPLGLITVAALLPKEWELRLVDVNVRPVTDQDWQWADLIMVTGMIAQSQSLLALVREAKNRGKPVVAGGPYPTSLPEEVLAAGGDFLVKGEAENALPLFLAALASGQTGGVFHQEAKPALTASPVPRFDLLTLSDYIALAVQTSRGCPYDCEFCDVVNLYGRKPRYKAPQQVLTELEIIYRLGWRKEIFICDDNFIGNKARAKEILHLLIPWLKDHGEPFSFWTQASVDLGQNQELMDLMTEANFSTVILGIESPDQDVLATAHKYQNLRHPLTESITNICANGLTVLGSFIMGFDGEKPGVGQHIASLVEATSMPLVVFNLLQPLPNTKLWRRLEDEGRLVEVSGSGDLVDTRLTYRPDRPAAQLIHEYLDCWLQVYEPSRFLARAYRYYQTMRPTRALSASSRGEGSTNAMPEKPRPLAEQLTKLFRCLPFFWRQGVKAPYRRQFWGQIMGIRRHNPSRMYKYLKMCIFVDDISHTREIMRQKKAGPPAP
jgi:radical SAM superfamily enzyme YgiQ (UPF0313 family)